MNKVSLVILVFLIIVGVAYFKMSNSSHKQGNLINNTLINGLDSYFADMEYQTHRKIPEKQKQLVIDFLNKSDIYKLDTQAIKTHRADFDKKRKVLIKEWESNTGEKWPTYDKDVIIKGKVVRRKGQNYDAHHIIELSWNGDNAWWNLTPAAYPNEHQGGIHRKGGVSAELFEEIPDYVGE